MVVLALLLLAALDSKVSRMPNNTRFAFHALQVVAAGALLWIGVALVMGLDAGG